ncbi:HNH endonuclease [Escherichia coli]
MAKKPTPDQVKKIRSGITKKIRFEVFKRDGFKCQYCGSSAPDVILHVDHINPVSKGGDNDMMNLITSCDSCNGGKSDKLLSDNSIMEKQRQQLQELNTKREQLEMMIKWRDGLK